MNHSRSESPLTQLRSVACLHDPSICAIGLVFMHIIADLGGDDMNVPVFLKSVTSKHFSIVVK